MGRRSRPSGLAHFEKKGATAVELAHRLYVAADFDPRKVVDGRPLGRPGVRSQVMGLARALGGSGVRVKVNSALRARGHVLIEDLHVMGLGVFADWKLHDIPETMETDAALLLDDPPEVLTVMCAAGVEGMRRVKQVLGDRTLVLGVTVLTSQGPGKCEQVYSTERPETVLRLAGLAAEAEIDGLILATDELPLVRREPSLACLQMLVTPGIRFGGKKVKGDDQEMVGTPRGAIAAGAEAIVMGRHIIGAKPNDEGLPENPLAAVQLALQEMEAGLRERSAA